MRLKMFKRHTGNQDEIPFIPSLIDIDDVAPSNGRLIPQEQIADIKARIAAIKSEDGRYSKKELGTKFSITRIHHQYFAIYKGEQHGKLIGKGKFGSVKFVQNIDTGTWAVIKTIRKKSESDQESHDKSISREKESLQKADHFIGHVQRKSRKKEVVQDEIIMILAPGTTVANIIKHRNMPAVKWLDLSIGIIHSTQELHFRELLHRDIKPANIIADTMTGTVKLVDFGLARKFDLKTRAYTGSYAGSPKYMAPEIEKHNKEMRSFNEATEVFALGITLIELFKLHRTGSNVEKTIESVQAIHNQKLLNRLCKLTASMVHKNMKKRPSLDDVFETLSDLRNNELDLVSKINSLVYLNVNEYMQLNDVQKENLFNALKNVDEVQLCLAPNPWSQEFLMVIRHDLETHGISVASHGIAFRHGKNTEKIIAQLKENTTQRGAHKGVIYSSYYLKLSKDTNVDYTNLLRRSIDSLEISSSHKATAISNIERQI